MSETVTPKVFDADDQTPDLAIELQKMLIDQSCPLDDTERQMLAPASLCLFEWRDYWCRLPHVDQLRVGARTIEPLPQSENLFRLKFENRLGLSFIQPLRNGAPACEPIAVEVISPKFPEIRDHVAFLSTLLHDLFDRITRLPFSLPSDTVMNVSDAAQPTDPFFVYHFLLQHGSSLVNAVNAIVANPHRELTTRDEVVPFHQAQTIDADMLVDIMHNPQRWVRSNSGMLANAMHGYAPTHIWQSLPEESVNTPENRFVHTFLRQVAQLADALPRQEWWVQIPDGHCEKVHSVTMGMHEALSNPFFVNVGDMRSFPYSSRILTGRSSYRTLREFYHLFQQARKPLFDDLNEAIDLRSVDVLYEQWVFFALTEEIAAALGVEPTISIQTTVSHGLQWNAAANFSNMGKLHYNRTMRSYSVPLRPDYIWYEHGRPTVALDAKFRMQRIVITDDLNAENAGEETLTVEGRAQRTDIYKMHTYRDALQVRSAVALYPGTEASFYDADGISKEIPTLRELLTNKDIRGIGAFPFNPTSPS